ncbi:3-phosphoshikimate 1-carboxyvinyltransferase [Pyrococcus sp. NA2]|uniref:3-phosphoshikimate 1-carboxyvinyltransferase n=1 Tax=Pyrococcus sp. (strain NA2) TaxID=342949 RepID=UPI000209A8E8|nr:3-phosphoshikimate 1-carboxyvinyltransferase [Pyrococcus sp. NA2]AEC51230.1 3-phosphoshikimate 1-carboxyvinyltransferase [Pyrococcus sp. NA2]
MIRIAPVDEVKGSLKAPPSKSYTHRAYFLALLAEGRSKVLEPLFSRDTLATLEAIKTFGALVDRDSIVPPGELSAGYINALESGTTARFSVAIAAIAKGKTTIDGIGRLRERPFDGLVMALQSLGVKVLGNRLPIVVYGGSVEKRKVEVNASKSSQFASALLLLASRIGLEVEIVNPVSRPYIEVTLKTMEAFGVEFERFENKISVYPGVRGTKFNVPGDYSSASFFLAAGALYGKVRVENLQRDDPQADAKILDVLEEFGANVRVGRSHVEVERNELRPLNIDCSDFPDLFPVLAVLASYAEGKSVITGRQLRFKESDRIHAIAVNLARAGIRVRELQNGLEIWGGKPKGFEVVSFNDHRIVMAMAVLALGADGETIVRDEQVVSKSYPNFFEDLWRILQ